jgi:lipopolysaccharide/colanic/teichoic acid biosynthesis glycosyltransferase
MNMKRLIDIGLSLFLIMTLWPVMLLTAAAVGLFLGRPIFFVQRRPGLNEKAFCLYKFRTMKCESNDGIRILADEQRLTRFGSCLRKLSLDELPQLWNVLKGDMSLVGPRPLLMEYLPLYTPEQARRHEVRPGITGWAQVNGRNAISWEDKFALDVWYVDHCSLWLDVRILWMTVKKVLVRDGISAAGEETMPIFPGKQYRF